MFCSHCGCDLRTITSEIEQDNDEQIPLVLLAGKIAKHKVLVIVSLLLLAVAFGGFKYVHNRIQKEREYKEMQEELAASLKHLMDIVGTYETSWGDIELSIFVDNTAVLKTNAGSYRERTYRGYWKEKTEDYPIEIDFTDNFEIYLGSKKRSYCTTLYFYDGRLWESLTAIRSHDYQSSERLTKKEKE